jgi:uncharacterized protein YdhG (YjbR/CyaY superfamily)
MSESATTVQEYLDALPADCRDVVRDLVGELLGLVPDADVVVGYGSIVLRRHDRALLGVSCMGDHCTLHLMSPTTAAALDGVLHEGRVVGATLRFDHANPPSTATLERIVAARLGEVDRREAQLAHR